MTRPIVLAWLAYTFIDVHLTLDSLVTWHTGAGVEPNVITAQGPILTRIRITFIYFSFTVYSLLEKREICVLKIQSVSALFACLSWNCKSHVIKSNWPAQ